MSRKNVVVNAGPRKGWNTDALLTEAAKGADSPLRDAVLSPFRNGMIYCRKTQEVQKDDGTDARIPGSAVL